jgi:hypothetical protein
VWLDPRSIILKGTGTYFCSREIGTGRRSNTSYFSKSLPLIWSAEGFKIRAGSFPMTAILVVTSVESCQLKLTR